MHERSAPEDPTTSRGATSRDGNYIAEVQGLRTIALAMVVVYHIWFHKVSGGIDIFLFISAYLITRSVLAAEPLGRWFNPVSFLVRRFARLMPLAVTVLVLTFVTGLFALPVWRSPALVEDAFGSLSYTMNHVLQDRAVDYYAIDPSVLSPFQHYWSLSLQGQAFVLWAILHALAVAAARVTSRPLRGWLAAGMGLLFIASFTYSVWVTSKAPDRAYFDTEARLWEFALGSLLAVVGTVSLPKAIRLSFTWLGLTLILACGFILPVQGIFPGYAALWPLGAASLIILASSDPNAMRLPLFSHPQIVRAGGYTYALYLVHWPVLTFAQIGFREVTLKWWQATLVMALTVLISFTLVRLVERPMSNLLPRRASLWRPAGMVVALAVAAASIGVAGERLVRTQLVNDPGAVASSDWRNYPEKCTGPSARFGCAQTPGFDQAGRKVVLVGSSHIQQFSHAFSRSFTTYGHGGQALLLPGCVFVEEAGAGRQVLCHEMWEAVRDGEVAGEADVIVALASISSPDGSEKIPAGLTEWVTDIRRSGRDVILVRDVPRFESNIFACGQQYGVDDPNCAVELPSTWDTPLAHPRATGVLDLTDAICPGLRCVPMHSDSIVYIDSHHISTRFAEMLGPHVDGQMSSYLDWWG